MKRPRREPLGGVARGPGACAALVGAFLRARGSFEITVRIGVEEGNPDLKLVLVEIDGTRAVFTPGELHTAGEAVLLLISGARQMGADDADVADMTNFATILQNAAEEATIVSPYGLH